MDELVRQATEAALAGARAEGVAALVSSALWFGVSGALFLLSEDFARRSRRSDDYDEELTVFSWISALLAGFVVLPGIWAWLDPMTWLALNNPAAYLARRVMWGH